MKRIFLLLFLIPTFAFATMLVSEDFEGTGTPSGWFRGASADFDYSAVPLAGLQSLRLDVSTSDYAQCPTLSAVDELWGEFMFKTETSLPPSFSFILYAEDAGASNHFDIGLFSDGTLSADGGATRSTGTMAAGTTYYVWWHFKKGTSSNATVECWFDTVNVRPAVGSNNYNGLTNRTENWQLDHAKVTASIGAPAVANVYDNFQVADTDAFAGGTPTPTPSPGTRGAFFFLP